MKLPYGVHDFKEIITENYVYCDRTNLIPTIENTGKSLLFIRPRRFGKSLLLSTLENYYDVQNKDKFDELFGHLKIAENPTELRNSFFILKFDFSCVESGGTIGDIKQSLYEHVNGCIKDFMMQYDQMLTYKIDINPNNALYSIKSLLSAVKKCGRPIYLLIDEYDNFANELMMSTPHTLLEDSLYMSTVTKDGPMKTLFKAIKSGSNSSGFAKTFITGVTPVVMSDITSGYNIAEDIYNEEAFNGLCGFDEAEVKNLLEGVYKFCNINYDSFKDVMALLKEYFNGHKFSVYAKENVYNPTQVIYFLKKFMTRCKPPREMLDHNLAVDYSKIEYISHLSRGRKRLFDLSAKNAKISINSIQQRFGIRELLSDSSKDNQFMMSYLYYTGSLTLYDKTDTGYMRVRIPNLIMKSLYIDRILRMLFQEPGNRDDGIEAGIELFTKGNIKPICDFMEKQTFKVFSNRDYAWANELTIKTAFLSLVYNDILYIMDSEKEINRSYIDLTMIIRPDKRELKIFDILVEFKFVKLSKAKLTAKQAKSLTRQELKKLPCIKSAMADAKEQAENYSKSLNKKYKKLKLKTFAVVCLGFERICWENGPD